MACRLRTGGWIGLASVFMFVCPQEYARASNPAPVDHDDSYRYRLPYADAASFAVLQTWGSSLSHTGSQFYTVDFRMPPGTPVHAAREGFVVAVRESQRRGCATQECARHANYVVIEHSDGTLSEYFHLQYDGVLVSTGEFVERGQQIALSGNTGYSSVPHLHFGVYSIMADGSDRSIDVQFATSNGVVRKLRSGGRYRNAATLSVASR